MIFRFLKKTAYSKTANSIIFSLNMMLIGFLKQCSQSHAYCLWVITLARPDIALAAGGEAVGDALNCWDCTHRQEAIVFNRILSNAPNIPFAFFSKEMSLNISPAAERFSSKK
jgi:hypothetical protein